MNRREYSAGAVKFSFWFMEFKTVVKLLSDGMALDEIKEKNQNENKGDTSREIIRNYFLNDFFKDHCNTYSVTGSGKRPIY